MAFCPNCGSEASGAFCPNCGATVATSAGSAPPHTADGSSYPASTAQPLSAPGMSDNVAGALCYLATVVTGIIFLVLAPYNQSKFVRFHAFQAIFFFIAWFVLSIAVGMLHILALVLWPLLTLAGLAIWLYLMFSAFNNKKVKLPIIGDLAEKQA